MPSVDTSFYQNLLQSAPFGYALHKVVLDEQKHPIDYTFVEVNPAFCLMTGLPQEQIVGRTVTQVLPNIRNDEFSWISFYGNLALTGGETEFEQYSHVLDRWFRVHAKATGDNGFTTIFWDKTNDRNADVALRESEEFHRALFEQTPDAQFILGNGIVLDCNPAAEELYHRSREELIGSHPSALSPESQPNGRSSMDLANEKILLALAGQTLRFEWIHKTKHHLNFPVEVSLSRLKLHGSFVLLATVRDLSERRIAEANLRARDQLLEKLSAQLPGVIYQYQLWPDGHSCFPFASHGIEQVYEVHPKDVKEDASLVFSRIHPDDLQRVSDVIFKSRDSLELWEDEYRVQLPKQGLRWLHGLAKPEKCQDGSVLWNGYIKDITERRQIEDKFRTYTESAPLAIFVINSRGFFEEVNAEASRMTGYDRPELLTINLHDIHFPDEAEFGMQLFYETYHKGSSEGIICARRNDGTPFWMQMHLSLLENQSVIAYCQDVTIRRNEQTRLAASEERLALTLDVTGEGVWDWHIDQGIVQHNRRWCEIVGMDDYLLEHDFQVFANIIHPEDRESVIGRVKEAMRVNGRYFSEHRMVRPDGSIVWVEDRGAIAAVNAQGEPTRMIGSISNITLRKAALDKLKKTSERLELALRAGSIGIWEWDIPSRTLYWDEQTSKLYGVLHSELQGGIQKWLQGGIQKWLQFVHPEDRSRCYQELMSVLQENRSANELVSEFRIIQANGQIRMIRSMAIVVQNQQGISDRILGTTWDITQQKESEQAALLASKTKSEFLANMSHEIRTPLNAVIGFAELLLGSGLDELQKQYAENVNIAGRSLLGIINDILDFSKIEAGKLELEAIGCDLQDILDEVTDIVKFQAAKKGLELLIAQPAKMPEKVILDPVRLKQILLNLIHNAIKFTSVGEVELDVQIQPIHERRIGLKFAVRDTGIGIKPEQKERLFQAFSQADSSTTRMFGGTGLGLIISNLLAQKMGSPIQLESEFGVGSTFYFTMEADCQYPRFMDTPKPSLQKVLLMDDHPRSLLRMQGIFEQVGCNAITASDIQTAQSLLEEHKPELLVIDFHQGQFNGLEALQQLRNCCSEALSHTSVVILCSAVDDMSMRKQCANQGIQANWIKPIKLIDVKRFLSEKKPTSNIPNPIQTQVKPMKIAHRRFLLVDDVAMNLLLIATLLRKIYPDAHIVEASNGLEAVHATQKEIFDIIFMDVQMPIMDGIEATQKIRELEKDSDHRSQIVALTAGALKEEMEKALTGGMDSILTKPIDTAKLKAILLSA